MKSFAKVYFWYHSILSEVLRGVFLLFLISLILVGVLYNIYPNIFITLFGLFLIFEIYFSQKIAKTVPKSEVGENSGDIFDSFTLETMAVFETQNDSKNLIKHLMSKEVKYYPFKCMHCTEYRVMTRYEMNNHFVEALVDHGLIISGRSADGSLVEIVESSGEEKDRRETRKKKK